MDFQTLRTFVEVVRQGGFSQAAKVVFTTQSTVSKAVKQLETELGIACIAHKSLEICAPKAFGAIFELSSPSGGCRTASLRIRRDFCGLALLDRKGHRSMLTAEGDVVYRRALKILAERDDLGTDYSAATENPLASAIAFWSLRASPPIRHRIEWYRLAAHRLGWLVQWPARISRSTPCRASTARTENCSASSPRILLTSVCFRSPDPPRKQEQMGGRGQ